MRAARFGRAGTRERPRSRWRDIAVTLAILLALAAAAHRVNRPVAFARSGPVSVHDGDTLTLGGERIRLLGIDAPELRQVCRRKGREYPCGTASRDALIGMIEGRDVSCRATKRDRYRRLLGECRAGRMNLNQALVRSGWAVTYGKEFRDAEAEARDRREGLWAGSFENPKEWRSRHGDAADLEYDAVTEWLVSLGEAVGLLDPAPADPSETGETI